MSKAGSFSRITTSRDELGFQKELVDSAAIQGGYGRKVSHPQLKGVSDLLIQLPGYTMAQLECKDLGLLTPGFRVMSGITEHQKQHVENLNRAAGARVAFYCFKVEIAEDHRCFFLLDFTNHVEYRNVWEVNIKRVGKKSWPGLSGVWHQLGVAPLDPTIHPISARR